LHDGQVGQQTLRHSFTCASWHLVYAHPELAAKIRDARHAVQFNESPAVDWNALLMLFVPIARAAAVKG
jgi:hypothetical protein